MVRDLRERIARSETFNPSQLGDPEMQLLEDALDRVAREHRKEKREMFARLLAANWTHVESSFDERLLFQRALDEFEELHLKLLRILRNANQEGQDHVHSHTLFERLFGDDADDENKFGVFVPALNKLASEYGFVRRRGERDGKLMVGINPEGLVFHLECLLLPLGTRFLVFLDGAE